MTTQECARAIMLGTYRPWETRSDVATPDQWRFYALCAIDGDEADLDICLDRLEEVTGERPECEFWKHVRDVP